MRERETSKENRTSIRDGGGTRGGRSDEERERPGEGGSGRRRDD